MPAVMVVVVVVWALNMDLFYQQAGPEVNPVPHWDLNGAPGWLVLAQDLAYNLPPSPTWGFSMPSLIERLVTAVRGPPPAPQPALRVVESVAGNFFYHLAPPDRMEAICDPERRVMHTSIPLDTWGYKSPHLPERYCAACEEIARRRGVQLGTD